jgi:hypothetical protein
VKHVSADNFGLVIAYLLPGFVALWGTSPLLPGAAAWLATPAGCSTPTVGGFLYGTLGSLAAGLLVSTVRWAVIDRLHHMTGIPEPRWDFSRFGTRVEAFDSLVQDHYRYYQFHANMLVAVAFAVAADLLRGARPLGQGLLPGVALLGIGAVLFLGSRDTLRKYYRRTAAVLGCVARETASGGGLSGPQLQLAREETLQGTSQAPCSPTTSLPSLQRDRLQELDRTGEAGVRSSSTYGPPNTPPPQLPPAHRSLGPVPGVQPQPGD